MNWKISTFYAIIFSGFFFFATSSVEHSLFDIKWTVFLLFVVINLRKLKQVLKENLYKWKSKKLNFFETRNKFTVGHTTKERIDIMNYMYRHLHISIKFSIDVFMGSDLILSFVYIYIRIVPYEHRKKLIFQRIKSLLKRKIDYVPNHHCNVIVILKQKIWNAANLYALKTNKSICKELMWAGATSFLINILTNDSNKLMNKFDTERSYFRFVICRRRKIDLFLFLLSHKKP